MKRLLRTSLTLLLLFALCLPAIPAQSEHPLEAEYRLVCDDRPTCCVQGKIHSRFVYEWLV